MAQQFTSSHAIYNVQSWTYISAVAEIFVQKCNKTKNLEAEKRIGAWSHSLGSRFAHRRLNDVNLTRAQIHLLIFKNLTFCFFYSDLKKI